MKTDHSSLLLDELKSAVARGLKNWLDANRADVLAAIRAATVATATYRP